MSRFAFIAFLFALVASFARAEPWGRPIVATNVDWDDNVAFMPTKIYVFHKATGEPKAVTTGEWAKIRDFVESNGKVPKPGTDWENYKVDNDDKKGSFREFRAKYAGNFFLDDIKEMLKLPEELWMGPSWKALLNGLSTPETAKWTTVITARGHTPSEMYEGLQYIKEWLWKKKKIRIFLPPKSNLHLVGQPKIKGDKVDLSGLKADILMKTLDRLQKRRLHPKAQTVLDRDGTSQTPQHVWGFSDDDRGNYEKAKKSLTDAIKANPDRWSKIKITLFYTGEDDPHEVVLTSKGETRPPKENELAEVEKLFPEGKCLYPYYSLAL